MGFRTRTSPARSGSRSASWLFSLVSWGVVGAVVARASEESFRWETRHDEARALALRTARPLLVYFPPVAPAQDPLVIGQAVERRGSSLGVVGLRVSGAEVVRLKEMLGVGTIPALVLVDRRERVVWKSEGPPRRDLPVVVEARLRLLAKAEERERTLLASALALAEGGRLEEACRLAGPLLEPRVSSPEAREGALLLLERRREELHRALLRILAAEGLDSDEAVLKALSALRDSTVDEPTRKAVEAEADRIRKGRIGVGT